MKLLSETLSKEKNWLFLVVLYVILVVLFVDVTIYEVLRKSLFSSYSLIVLSVVTYGIFAVTVYVYKHRPERPLTSIYNLINLHISERNVKLQIILTFIFILIFISTFWASKIKIIPKNEIGVDLLLSDFDKFLHFGFYPGVLLFEKFGNWVFIYLLNTNYTFWMPIQWGVFTYFAFVCRDKDIRLRYVTAYVLSWAFVGTLLAHLMPSVGPCYFEHYYPGLNPYESLMDGLVYINQNIVPLATIQVQERLWLAFRSQDGVNFGISAMPSMHNAISILNVFVFWSNKGFTRYFFLLHAVLVFIGSIMLGWHYAVDGYVALFGVAAIWVLSGKLTKQNH